jgi:integrase
MEVGKDRARSAGRFVGDVLDAWVDQNLDTWAASSARDQQSRVASIKRDPISRIPLARLTVADVERWHTRLRHAGLGDSALRNQHGVLRAALAQALRWGWISTNMVSLARVRPTKAPPRHAMTVGEVRAVLVAAGTIDPAAELALRLAAVAGARRSELAALRWNDLRDGRLTIDSAVEASARSTGVPISGTRPRKRPTSAPCPSMATRSNWLNASDSSESHTVPGCSGSGRSR